MNLLEHQHQRARNQAQIVYHYEIREYTVPNRLGWTLIAVAFCALFIIGYLGVRL